jgi:hypothetical protein
LKVKEKRKQVNERKDIAATESVEGARKKEKIRRPEVKKNCARREPNLPMPSASTSSSAACAGCGETFDDDWVQCGSCLEW